MSKAFKFPNCVRYASHRQRPIQHPYWGGKTNWKMAERRQVPTSYTQKLTSYVNRVKEKHAAPSRGTTSSKSYLCNWTRFYLPPADRLYCLKIKLYWNDGLAKKICYCCANARYGNANGTSTFNRSDWLNAANWLPFRFCSPAAGIFASLVHGPRCRSGTLHSHR